MTTNLEDTTDKSLAGMGVTEVHITHMKMPEDCYYSHITLATQKAEEYRVLDIAVNTIFLEGSIKHIIGSALDALVVQRFAESGAGASPCHAIDNFSRKRGRIIAKGRLLKQLEAAEQTEPEPGMMTGECRYCHKNFEYPYAHGLIEMIRAHEATCPERPKGDGITIDETDVPIVPQAPTERGAGT